MSKISRLIVEFLVNIAHKSHEVTRPRFYLFTEPVALVEQ